MTSTYSVVPPVAHPTWAKRSHITAGRRGPTARRAQFVRTARPPHDGGSPRTVGRTVAVHERGRCCHRVVGAVTHPVETEAIAALDLPLNFSQNSGHPFHARLTALRADAKARARALPIAFPAPHDRGRAGHGGAIRSTPLSSVRHAPRPTSTSPQVKQHGTAPAVITCDAVSPLTQKCSAAG